MALQEYARIRDRATYLPSVNNTSNKRELYEPQKKEFRWSLPVKITSGMQTLLLAGNIFLGVPVTKPSSTSSNSCDADPYRVPAQYDATARSIEQYSYTDASQSALSFIFSHRQEDGVFLTSLDQNNVVPMDNAHVAMALAQAGHVKEAKETVNWFLERMTKPGDNNEMRVITTYSGEKKAVSYAGSWFDQYYKEGTPQKGSMRGRGESVGLMLIALHTILREDPTYLQHEVNGKRVSEHMKLMVKYLGTLQQENGTFVHRHEFVPFDEENARMIVGILLAATQFENEGDVEIAKYSYTVADKGLAALIAQEGINKGMAYDYIAKSMWGLCGKKVGRMELRRLQTVGLLRGENVQVYDWKQEKDKREAIKNLPYGTAETADLGITYVMLEDLLHARKVIEQLTQVQQADGGFPNKFFFPLSYLNRLEQQFPDMRHFTIYTAARFLVLVNLYDEAKRMGIDIHRLLPSPRYTPEFVLRKNREYTYKNKKKLLKAA